MMRNAGGPGEGDNSPAMWFKPQTGREDKTGTDPHENAADRKQTGAVYHSAAIGGRAASALGQGRRRPLSEGAVRPTGGSRCRLGTAGLTSWSSSVGANPAHCAFASHTLTGPRLLPQEPAVSHCRSCTATGVLAVACAVAVSACASSSPPRAAPLAVASSSPLAPAFPAATAPVTRSSSAQVAPIVPSPIPTAVMTTRSPVLVLPPLTGRTVVLDPGHNGLTYMYPVRANALVPAGGFLKACQTTGTSTDDGYSEHAFNWVLANRTAALLRAQGARVVLSRPDDAGVGPCVNQRAALANAAQALLVISLHADGGPSSGYGFHVIEAGLSPDGGNRAFLVASHRLALDVRRGYQAATGESYSTYLGQQGLDRRSDLAGLNLTRLPAVFIECGNMRNSSDAAKLSSAAFQQRAAQGLLAAVEAFAAGR